MVRTSRDAMLTFDLQKRVINNKNRMLESIYLEAVQIESLIETSLCWRLNQTCGHSENNSCMNVSMKEPEAIDIRHQMQI